MEELAFTNAGDFIRISAEFETEASLPSNGAARVRCIRNETGAVAIGDFVVVDSVAPGGSS
jgi:hypothetical protein